MDDLKEEERQKAAREQRKARLFGFLFAVLIAVLIGALQMIDIYANAHHTATPHDAAEQ